MKYVLINLMVLFGVSFAGAKDLKKSIQENKSMIVSQCYLQQKEVFAERSRIFHEMMKDCVRTKFKGKKLAASGASQARSSASVEVLKVDERADFF